MYRFLLFSLLLLLGAPELAAASGGLELATEWDWWRDGGRIVNSVIVLGATTWLAIKFVGPMLTKRADDIAENLESLQRATVEAEATLKEYDAKLTEIGARATDARKEAEAEGELIKEKIVTQARDNARRIVERATAQIEMETTRAKDRLHQETLVAAIDMAQKIIAEKLGPEDQSALVSSFLKKMERTN